MKRIILLTATIIYGCILTTSCDEGNECSVDIDPAPTPICFIVKDADGNNLLDNKFEGNIIDNGISVTYNGGNYPLTLSEYDPYGERGLYIGEIGADKIPGLLFGFFYIGKDRGESEFIINWGNGTSDNVKFQYYYNVVRCNPEAHRKIYLNRTLQSGNSLTATIIK